MLDVTLIALDLDGTLLHDDHKISDYTINVWKKLHKKGIHVVPASGRPFLAMKKVLPVRMCEYLVCTNGVHVFKNTQPLDTSEPVWEEILDKSFNYNDAKLAFDMQHRTYPKVHVHCYVGNYLYALKITPELTEYQQRSGIPVNLINSWHELENKQISKIMCVSSHSVLENLKNEYKPLRNKFEVTFSMPTYLEIFSAEASKAEALGHVIKRCNTTKHNCLAIGDSHNDLPMLELCKHAYVMKNALSEVAPHLPRTQYTNNEDGVAKLLEQLFLSIAR